MEKEFDKLTAVEIFAKIWLQISKDRRFKKLLKGKKEKIKNSIEINLRQGCKDKSPKIFIDAFWTALHHIYRDDRKEPEISPYIQREINNIIQKQFE